MAAPAALAVSVVLSLPASEVTIDWRNSFLIHFNTLLRIVANTGHAFQSRVALASTTGLLSVCPILGQRSRC
jgi:hypothetical protein